MTSTNDSSRLDRIEELLAQTAIQTALNAQAIASSARSIEVTEQNIASNARAIEANSNSLAETRAIVESTARTVAANADAITENTEAIASLREAVVTFIDGVQAQGMRLDEIASEVRGLQTENRRILEILERRDSEGAQDA